MATGIISLAAAEQGWGLPAMVFFAIDLIAFPSLVVLLSYRLARNPAAIVSELSHHHTAPGFLTLVAAAAVLGNQFAVLTGDIGIAAILWLIGCVFWAGLIYAFFILLTIRSDKPAPRSGPDGGWLLIVVATEALAVLGTYVDGWFARADIVIWLSLCWYLLGGLFYLIVIQLILNRWLFGSLRPDELTPSYWINMGAMAIATLAGSRLQLLAGTEPLLTVLRPAIAASAMLYWAVAAWWIPLLASLMIWRHTAGGVPLSYRFEYWSMVFPLGMFTAATWSFSHINDFAFLYWLPRAFIWLAVAAWIACFAGIIRRTTMTAVTAAGKRRQ